MKNVQKLIIINDAKYIHSVLRNCSFFVGTQIEMDSFLSVKINQKIWRHFMFPLASTPIEINKNNIEFYSK